ncbi:hypothetical protein [Fundidesulfovibrio soli]|uniref:hypothetical protein n=1 Tax=Fundidesulfovibrio soli TaxID=2922716 RepID=UPI001FAED1B7|nr:hypothetical protein [Fundidesulfovibrio soli]
MPPSKLREGQLVQNPKTPSLGPGKVVAVAGDIIHVIWRDANEQQSALKYRQETLVLAEIQSDPILDNLPPLREVAGKWLLPAKRLMVADAVAKFTAQFPNGFYDPAYYGDRNCGERNYKLEATYHYEELLGLGQARQLLEKGDLEELSRRTLKVLASINYLDKRFGEPLFKEALADRSAASRYFMALFNLLDAPTVSEETFSPYAEAVCELPVMRRSGRVATWPVATALPYIAQPHRHVYLKPSETQAAADRLGFNLNYSASPNWRTYSCYLKMCDIYRDLLTELKPRDYIDIQSFIYVTCGGYDR